MRNTNLSEDLEKLYKLKSQINQLTDEFERLKPLVVAQIKNEGLEESKFDFGDGSVRFKKGSITNITRESLVSYISAKHPGIDPEQFYKGLTPYLKKTTYETVVVTNRKRR
jgi:hypothetical protein